MKCRALLPCERVIIDKDGAHSIINVMLNAEVSMDVVGPSQMAQPMTIPPNAMTGTTWWLYTLWEPSGDDVGKDFEQVYQVYWPNGDKLLESRLSFTQKDDTMNQTTFYIAGFPVGQQGRVKILTWLDSQGHRVSDVVEGSVNIKHGTDRSGRPTPALARA